MLQKDLQDYEKEKFVYIDSEQDVFLILSKAVPSELKLSTSRLKFAISIKLELHDQRTLLAVKPSLGELLRLKASESLLTFLSLKNDEFLPCYEFF